MPEFMDGLLRASFAGGVFILAAYLIRAGLKKHLPKRFLVLLWAAVLLRLLVVFGMPSPTSLYNFVLFRNPLAGAGAPVPANGWDFDQEDDAIDEEESLAAAGGVAFAYSRAAFVVWATGTLALGALFLVNYRRAADRFGAAFLLKNRPAVARWAAAKTNPPKVYVSDRTATPVAFGLLRPRIILPAGLDLDDAALVGNILEHEYAHCRHFHNLMKSLVYAAAAIHWFNPLAWIFWFLFNHDIELVCDEKVIDAIGAGKRAAYAKALVKVAESAVFSLPALSPFAARNIKERIVDVMEYKRSSIGLVGAEIGLALAAFAVFGTTSGAISGWDSASGGEAAPPFLTFDPRLTPRDVALSAAGGGTIIKREIAERNGGSVHEYRILSNGQEFVLKIDPAAHALTKYEKNRARRSFASLNPAEMLTLEEAERLAVRAVGGGRAFSVELRHARPGRFFYTVGVTHDSISHRVELDAVNGDILRSEIKAKGKSRGR